MPGISKEALPDIRHGRHFGVQIPGLKLKVGYFTEITGFSSQLGFHPDFDLREVLPDYHAGDVSRVNLFQKVVRLRNGVSHKL